MKLNPNELTLQQATEEMKKLQALGYDCWFKTVANKDTRTLEVHIIVQDKVIRIINTINNERRLS